MSNPLLPSRANADNRPRVHVRQDGNRTAYRYGPTGMERYAATPGEAFEEIVAGLGGQAAVIIYGEEAHG